MRSDPGRTGIRIHSAQLVKPDRTVVSSNETGTARGNGEHAL